MSLVTYRRVQHAAHYSNHPMKGHDLEQWDVEGNLQRGDRTGKPIAPDGVPNDAQYHSGYRTGEGVQHWVFVRVAPMTGTCRRCEAAAQ